MMAYVAAGIYAALVVLIVGGMIFWCEYTLRKGWGLDGRPEQPKDMKSAVKEEEEELVGSGRKN